MIKVDTKKLIMNAKYKVQGTCLRHGCNQCEYVGILDYLGSSTFAFDSNDEGVAEHQYRLSEITLLELIPGNNKQMSFKLEKEF